MNETEIEKEGVTLKRKSNMKYMIIMIIILGLAHALDEYSSLANSYIESSVLLEFFGSTPAQQQQGLQIMTALGSILIVLMLFGVFFKGLQDKYGRRRIFIISTFGMTIGVLVISISPSFPIYYLGYILMGLFLFNDMQYVYINEETPTDKRAQAFAAAKIVGLAAILVIPFIRSVSIVEGNEQWRPVYYFPLIIGVIVIILSIVFLKEPHAYKVLQEDRKNNPEKYKDEKISLRQAYRDLKKTKNWPQIKWLLIIMMVFGPFAMLNQSHSELFMDQAGINEATKNVMLLISTLSVGLAYLIQGQLADRLGRKIAYLANLLAVIVLLPVEFIAMYVPVLYWLAAMAQGLRIGAFWNVTDVSRFLIVENVPTRIRGNAQVISGLALFIVLPLSLVLSTVLVGIFYPVHIVLMVVGIPLMIIALVLTKLKVKETVHIDITKIEG